MCRASAFQQSSHTVLPILCGMTGAAGFEVLSINPALAAFQRKEVGVVKAPHWVVGVLSATLRSPTEKTLLILGVFLTLFAPPQFPHL